MPRGLLCGEDLVDCGVGEIDGVATVSFVGYHEHRHFKQIREVLKKIKYATNDR